MSVELSVVIVTYRCLPFTQLCLQSLLWKNDSRMEVIVVDNNSCDGSTVVLKEQFPVVKFIENNKNVGFGTACNQGMSVANGRYFLMLNPDTVVPENITDLVLDFMKSHPECGAMGVKMIDGGGSFLPESKRGIPTLTRAFFKFVGLSFVFPDSSSLSGYYLGHLPHDKKNEIEILSGAFMVLDSQVIKITGGFDEDFFMYGEDIDLSYRILQAGYKVIYYPEITILHFKGESTIRNFKYIKSFYGAMELFYKRHFKGKNKKIRFILVRTIIYLFAALANLKNKITVPIENLRKSSRLIGNWIWVRENNLDGNFDQIIPAKFFIGKNMGVKTVDEILNSKTKVKYCILSLSNLAPSESIHALQSLSGKGYRCIWKEKNQNWVFMGWSASSHSRVKKCN